MCISSEICAVMTLYITLCIIKLKSVFYDQMYHVCISKFHGKIFINDIIDEMCLFLQRNVCAVMKKMKT